MTTGAGPRQLSPLAQLVRFFALHRTAGNLLLMIALLAGALGLMRLNSQFFPTIDFPIVTVKVSWPGASAEDMEKTVVRNLEPALSRVEGLDDLLGVAREGRATMTLRFAESYDMQKALADVKQAVDGVTTLPADAEEPVIRRAVRFELVAKLLITGRLPEAELKRLARDIRDRFLSAGIARVTIRGARPEEIRVAVPAYQMLRLDLDLDRIAARLRAEIADTPAGDITGGVEKSVRRAGAGRSAADLAQVVIATEPLGGRIRLGDVAAVRDDYDEQAPRLYAGRQRAIELSVWRTPETDTLKTTALFERELKKIRASLPATVELTAFDVRARHLRDRINLLLNNGAQGLLLVLVILFIFLSGRVAFWVAAGIPVALMATMAAMWMSGQTINMISLFALIMTLGIIVDDAIVVGEHTATLRSRGLSPEQAAEQGALRMLAPVLAAILTTIAAFIPLFFFEGRIGAIIIALPMVVIAVLIASLIECFLILPMHLRHSLSRAGPPGAFRRRFDAAFVRFRDGAFARIAAFSYDWRYALWAAMILALIIAIALPVSGRLRFNFFPAPESEFLTARIVMAAGAPEHETLKAVEAVHGALRRVEERLGRGEKLIRATVASIGQAGRSNGNHLARLDVQLTGSEERSVRTRRLLHAWRRALPPIPGVERISLGRRFHGGAVNDLEIVLKGDEPTVLKAAAQEIIAILKRIEGLTNIADDLPWGKSTVRIELTPRGQALGFTADGLARQVRAALQGVIATRFARHNEEVSVLVKRADAITSTAVLRAIRVRSASGVWLPLAEVAELRERPGFSVLFRRDGKAVMSISANVDKSVSSIAEAVAAIEASDFRAILARHGITAEIKGSAEEMRESMRDLKIGAVVALLLIYVILAWVFASYTHPLIIMTVIPFGAIGAILGHLLLGYSLTILSLIGLLGLTGILVNDSIILLTRAQERMRHGEEVRAAAVGAARDRLRAVLLTTLTTIGGLTPLLFEKSLQAQFLQPMAITIVFGLGVATLIVLLLVPATLGVWHDLGRLLRRLLPAAPAAAG